MVKKSIALVVLFFNSFHLLAQIQVSVGSPANVEVFNDTKYNTSDGSTVNVGYTGVSGVGTGTDCYIVKLDVNQQVVWQKTIANPGNDFLSKVQICANGDYIACGEFSQSGLQWGIVCRINSTTGYIIWSTTSIGTASTYGDEFYNLIETTTGDIAVVGSTDFKPGPVNSMVVLLNSNGTQKWCEVSDYNSSDEIQTVNQQSNGNLIVCGHYYLFGQYYVAFVMELDESTGAITSKNDYTINISDPLMAGNTLNTLWPFNGYVNGTNVAFSIGLTQGCCGPGGNLVIYSYDPTTKALTGNLYYHKGYSSSGGDAATVLGANDYIIAENNTTSSGQDNLYVARVTNGTVIYDRRIDTTSANMNITAANVNGNNLFLSGSDSLGSGDAYQLSSTIDFPTSTGKCSFSDADSLIILPNTPAQSANTISLNSVTGVMIPITLSTTAVTGSANPLCSSTVLASTIGSLNAYVVNKNVNLNWQVYAEADIKTYAVQKSTDGIHFVTISQLDATGSTGYTYSDDQPINGNNYYRLLITNEDGSINYSNVDLVNVSTTSTIVNFYPNPIVNHTLTVQLANIAEGSYQLILFDEAGKQIYSSSVEYDGGYSTQTINLPSSINSGLYEFRLKNAATMFNSTLLIK